MRGGFYRMHRGWMDNPAFGGSREKFCRRAAWVWLIENASWDDGKIDAAGKTITLRRGQLCHSFRHMAEAWGWSLGAVQRFIDRLQTDTMIDTATDTGRMIVTICNYDKYQACSPSTDTVADTATDNTSIQDRYEVKEAKGNKNPPKPPRGGRKGKAVAKQEDGEPVYTDEERTNLRAIADAYPKRAGSQGWKDAGIRMTAIVSAGRATWEELLRITKIHHGKMEKANNIGTRGVPMASTYFGDEKGYWSEELDAVRRSASPSNANDLYRKILTDYSRGKPWDAMFGPLPRAPGCEIPASLVEEILGPPPVASRPTLTVVNA